MTAEREHLVVDASVVVQAVLAEPGLASLAAFTLAAPPGMPSEALSVLHELVWRREISARLGEVARRRLAAAPIDLIRHADLLERAWSVADTLGWAKTYDAEYVALAALLDCRLATLDARLARGAGHLVRIVGPAELVP